MDGGERNAVAHPEARQGQSVEAPGPLVRPLGGLEALVDALQAARQERDPRARRLGEGREAGPGGPTADRLELREVVLAPAAPHAPKIDAPAVRGHGLEAACEPRADVAADHHDRDARPGLDPARMPLRQPGTQRVPKRTRIDGRLQHAGLSPVAAHREPHAAGSVHAHAIERGAIELEVRLEQLERRQRPGQGRHEARVVEARRGV